MAPGIRSTTARAVLPAGNERTQPMSAYAEAYLAFVAALDALEAAAHTAADSVAWLGPGES